MKPLKAGAVGCGLISGIYLKTLAKCDAIESVACASLVLRIEEYPSDIKGHATPTNINGATAANYAERGSKAPLARGLFCLSRSVDILAHAWEQTKQGGRNKGPLPRGISGPTSNPTCADKAGRLFSFQETRKRDREKPC